MLAVIAGLILAIMGVVLWLGSLTLGHAVAAFLVVIGCFILLSYAVPVSYYRRSLDHSEGVKRNGIYFDPEA